MALFTRKTFKEHDHYMTPWTAWNDIKEYIPKGKKLYAPFYGDGSLLKNFKKIGFEVLHEKKDFFKVASKIKYDVIIDNPPFTIKKEVFTKLKELDKPFIILCPSSTINTQYMRGLFKDKLQIIIPKKRIQFIKTDDKGVKIPTKTGANFDCFYYCYKMKLKHSITWL